MRTTRLLLVFLAVAGFFVPQRSVAVTPVDTAALVMQDSLNARSLIFSEMMLPPRGNRSWGYAELYNSGESDLDMSRYFLSTSNYWGDSWNLNPYENSGKKHLKGILKPGEVYLVVQSFGNGEVTPYQVPIYPNGYCNEEAAGVAEYRGNYWSSGADPDSIPEMKITYHHLALAYNGVIDEYQDSVYRDSILIDRFGIDRGDGNENPGITWSIAGVVDNNPVEAAVYVRKIGVKKGNTVEYTGTSFNDVPITFWDESRGTDITDSEWIPLPTSQSSEFDKIFTTVDYHGPQPEFSVTSDVATVDEAAKLITLPYGTSRDSVFRLFTTGPNHAWELKLGADTGQFYVQEDDSIFFYTVGEDLVTKKFGIKTSGEKTKTAQVAPLVYKNDNDVFVRNYNISNGEAPIDSIGTLPYNLPVDTFYTYMVKEEGATWDIIPASGTKSPEIKNGDKLIVTAADGETTKEYYLGVRPFFPSHNADITSVYFPGLQLWENPNTYLYTDTLLNFNSTTTFYSIDLASGSTVSPAMVATASDHRAKVVINRAKDIKGADADRTATIIVTAEDDTTIKEFKFLFNVERETPEIQGSLFFSDIATSWGGYNSSTNIQIFNPSPEAVDMTDYMFICWPDGAGIQNIISSFPSDSDWTNQNNKFLRFGSIVEPAEDGTPVFKADLFQSKIMLESNEVFGISNLGGWPLMDAYKGEWQQGLVDEHVDIVTDDSKGITRTNWPVQGYHDYYAPKTWGTVDPYGTGHLALGNLRANFSGPKAWMSNNLGIVRILNDSIKDGTKHVIKDFFEDYEFVDIWGGETYDIASGRLYDNDTVQIFAGTGARHGVYRKPNIYKGNPVDGLSMGTANEETLKTVYPSEWTIYGWGLPYGAKGWKDGQWDAIRNSRVGAHVMITYAHIPYLTSSKYILEEGLTGPQQAYGVTAGTTVNDFLANVNKADTGMMIKVLSSDGTELTGTDPITAGTNVWSKSANGADSVNYVISSLGELSNACTLTSTEYTVNTTIPTGVISGIKTGTTLKDVLSKLTAPENSFMSPTNGGEMILPLEKFNRDTIEIQKSNMTDVLASTRTYIEVLAQDKVTKCIYSLEFEAEEDPFVLSDVYVIDQVAKVINFAGRTSPDKFKANLIASTGASIKVVNKYDQERMDGVMEYSDRLIVTKGDVSVEYWVNYTINEDIIGQAIKEVDNHGFAIYPNPTTDFVTLSGISGKKVEVRDIAGKVISKKTINSTEYVVDMRSLSTGIYIISTEDASYKVVKE